jgi:hypothetical protein
VDKIAQRRAVIIAVPGNFAHPTLATSWAGQICAFPPPGHNRGHKQGHDIALDESLRSGVFGKLKLVICAPISDLSGVGFVLWLRQTVNPAMRETAPGLFLAQPLAATGSMSLP